MQAKRIYVSGPMRGYEHFNFAAFDQAREALRTLGFEVMCPAERDRQEGFDETLGTLDGFDLQAAFRRDVECILACDFVALLDGWEKSAGATLEVSIAKAIGVECVPVSVLLVNR